MSPEDPRTARTKARLRASLLAECADRPLGEVSASAVGRRAGAAGPENAGAPPGATAGLVHELGP